MKHAFATFAALGLAICAAAAASADLLTNGNLDLTESTEIIPGFFLPKPQAWANVGSRSISGPYEDELSSEPWAGPAPTPVTTDGNANPPHPEGCGGADCGVFFKPFTGNATDGSATGHLLQDALATPGERYTLTGWAGVETNALLGRAEFALEFFGGGGMLGDAVLDLIAAGLFTDNGMPFDYKQYSLSAVAPPGTLSVRVRVSMIDALINPSGGGQAFVVDDFTLTAPEPATVALLGLALVGLAGSRSRARSRPGPEESTPVV